VGEITTVGLDLAKRVVQLRELTALRHQQYSTEAGRGWGASRGAATRICARCSSKASARRCGPRYEQHQRAELVARIVATRPLTWLGVTCGNER
jgi:hypothetical protein